MPNTVLGRSLGMYVSFPAALPRYLRDRANGEETAVGPTSSPNVLQRIRLLRDTADYIEDLDPNEPALYALAQIQGTHGDSDTFSPTNEQEEVISNAGLSALIPSPETVVNELVMVGVLGLINDRTKLRRKMEERELAAQVTAELNERITELEVESKDKDALVQAAEARANEAEATQSTLRALLSVTGDAPDQIPATYRRLKFEGDPPGLSRTRRKPDGPVVYELKKGSRSWQTFKDRDEAIAAAEALREPVGANA